ncbi:MAG: L-seryl-tRNA(Sec) selenium transferase [Desulfomonilia bacterium]|jgi:L-seryl-tRNA(Ser) seleniumtransferase
MKEAYRSIPKVDAVLREPALMNLPYAPELVKRAVQDALEKVREAISRGDLDKSPDAARVAAEVAREIVGIMASGLVEVINAAGVVVYTNLGRAPLAAEAINAMVEAGRGYSDLEYDLGKGSRGSRQSHIRPVTRSCFGAEDALVVNNNAAAVLLVLSTLARGREVIVSRGELVEIGGSFRMPEVMAMSGALMREVGATNRTRLSDYRSSINDNTGLIIKVHRSNFSIVGFTEEVELRELSELAREFGIPLYVDMGSGIPFDLTPYGIPDEWTIPGCLEFSDVLSFSGDKVLGGPQAGIILGRTELVERMSRNPLHRALRIDKLAIASLSATLGLLSQGRYRDIPVLRMLVEDPSEVRARAERLRDLLGLRDAEVVPTRAVVGGGSAPTKSFPSYGLVLRRPDATALLARLRAVRPAVVARIEDDRITFDLKAVDAGLVEVLAEKIREALGDGL